MSNVENNVQRLHDILKSYYKVAFKRFVDNVCMQAADHHLVRGQHTAVKVFSPGFVSDLTEEQLERIAGEDAVTKRKRADLTRQLENLKKAKSLLMAVRDAGGVYAPGAMRLGYIPLFGDSADMR